MPFPASFTEQPAETVRWWTGSRSFSGYGTDVYKRQSMQSPITNFARVIKQIAEKDGEAVAETAEAPAEEAAETTAE